MSFRALVVPEDPTLNGYILKPLARGLLAHAGKPSARVELLTDPRVRGYDEAVRVVRDELADRYRFFFDLWLFFPDADRASDDAMKRLEADLEAQGITLLCCPALPELEIYACAAFRDDLDETWENVRKHPRLKEDIFRPLLDRRGDPRRPGRGRDLMTETSLRNLRLLFQLCPELERLRDRIAAHVRTR